MSTTKTNAVAELQTEQKQEDKEFMSQCLERFHKVHDDFAFLKAELGFDRAPSTFSTGELADFSVWLREMKSVLEAREKLMTEILKTRHKAELEVIEKAWKERGVKETVAIKGHLTPGLVFEFVAQQRLDSEAVAKEMGAEWVEDHKKPVEFFQGRVGKVSGLK